MDEATMNLYGHGWKHLETRGNCTPLMRQGKHTKRTKHDVETPWFSEEKRLQMMFFNVFLNIYVSLP